MRTSRPAALAVALAALPAQADEPPQPAPPARALFDGDARELAATHPNVTLREIGRSRGGRPVELVRVLPPGARDEDVVWEALLVAGLSGRRPRDEARLALDVAARLAERGGALPEGCAFLVLADASPDATAWTVGVRTRAGNDSAADDDQDGDADEDGPDDLDGDGRVSWMRFPDPAGDQCARTDEKGAPVMEAADVARGRLPTHRLVLEGRDDDADGRFNEDGPGGVDVARNFTWRFEEHVPAAGRWPASESETRAVLDLLLADERIAVVYEFGDAETVKARPGWGGAWTQLPDPDVALLDGLRAQHAEGAKVPREPRAPGGGSLGLATLHHLGRLWFGRSPRGTLPPLASAAFVRSWRPCAAAGAPPGAELGDPEPPPNLGQYDLAPEGDAAAQFLADLAGARARLEFRGTETGGAQGALTVRTRVANAGRLPTHTQRGAEVKGRRPVNVRVRLPEGAKLEAGRPLVQIERLAGGSESEQLAWVVRGPSGASVVVEAVGPDTGAARLVAVIP